MRLMPLPAEAKLLQYHAADAAFRRALLVYHLRRNNLRTRATARALGVAPGTLLAAIKSLGIGQDDFDALAARERRPHGEPDDTVAILDTLERGNHA